jgi:hypothetical protein
MFLTNKKLQKNPIIFFFHSWLWLSDSLDSLMSSGSFETLRFCGGLSDIDNEAVSREQQFEQRKCLILFNVF